MSTSSNSRSSRGGGSGSSSSSSSILDITFSANKYRCFDPVYFKSSLKCTPNICNYKRSFVTTIHRQIHTFSSVVTRCSSSSLYCQCLTLQYTVQHASVSVPFIAPHCHCNFHFFSALIQDKLTNILTDEKRSI